MKGIYKQQANNAVDPKAAYDCRTNLINSREQALLTEGANQSKLKKFAFVLPQGFDAPL